MKEKTMALLIDALLNEFPPAFIAEQIADGLFLRAAQIRKDYGRYNPIADKYALASLRVAAVVPELAKIGF